MSYLDLPRLHFSGLFYTGPSTINNITENYIPTTVLENAPDQYNPSPQVAGWNPTGVAQWWLEQCSVLSAVGPAGNEITSSGDDLVIGALVQSPSPTTPMSDGATGYYDIAKMVDLDPDQQGRSALYGVRISVTLPSGAGFQGLLTVAELRQLNGRIAGAQGSYGAVGNWMGTLQDVVWSGDISTSPILTALQTAATEGLAVKLTADLHQNNQANIFTAGDLFCYGRVLGSIGPALAGELSQVVPGRCIQTYPPPQPPTPPQPPAAVTEALQQAPGARLLQGRDLVVSKLAAIPVAAATAITAQPPTPWNPAFCVIRGNPPGAFLHLDIGGCLLLQSTGTGQTFHSDGTFVVSDGIEAGVLNPASQQFTPFSSGALSFTERYVPLTSPSKNCEQVNNSGVFTVSLTAADVSLAAATPIAIAVNGTVVAAEFSGGYWIDVAVASQRLQCGGTNGETQIMVRQWGQPVVGFAPPLSAWWVQLFEWILVGGQWTNPPTLPSSNDLALSFTTTDTNGLATVTTTIDVPDLTLPAIRVPLDSYMYYASMTDPDGNAIGDGPGGGVSLSVLLWNTYQAPASPTWADVSPVMAAYARLYPGMKSILDISDPTTVSGFAPVILGRMKADVTDPAFMPVTRDLSPTKTQMVLQWLASQPGA